MENPEWKDALKDLTTLAREMLPPNGQVQSEIS